MFRKDKLPELLAPAGDMECLYAAVAAGADAVYLGGKRFGARAFAKNFDIDELKAAVRYCHLHNVKLYVTLNILVEDREMAEVVEYAAQLYRIGIDALIVADLGAIAVIRRHIPDLEIHASTQASVHSTLGADAMSRLGVSRTVVARELSLGDIKTIVDNSEQEIEVFLHGALCVCYSGQCLFSSLVGGRSGNRGECAQPCRLPYNGDRYPLSLKDLSLAYHIPALIDAGVSSLKIEGRMKNPAYVYTVTSVYRRLLDERRAANADERDLLRRAFSRGGFTDGYFVDKSHLPMTGIRSDADKEDSRALTPLDTGVRRVKVSCEAVMRLGEPCTMTLRRGARSVTVTGAVPQVAENAPLTPDAVKARLAKMGNTFLSLDPSDIDLTLEEGINLPPSMINALRRDAAEAFEYSGRELSEIEYTPLISTDRPKSLVTAEFLSEDRYLTSLDLDPSFGEDIDISFIPLFSSLQALGSAGGVALPSVVFDSQLEAVKLALMRAKEQGVRYALINNIGQIQLVRDIGLTPIGGFRLNITNTESLVAYEKLGVDRALLSPELTTAKAGDIGGGIIAYGRIPLMLTERCFMRENFGCQKCSECSLTDRKGERFPILREYDHRNLILNSRPTYMGDRKDELKSRGIYFHHFIFSIEGARRIKDILSAYRSGRSLDIPVRRMGRR